MATGALDAQGVTGAEQASRRGVFDKLLTLVDVLPGPAVVWLALLALILVAVAHLWIWATGGRPVGQLETEVVPPTLIVAYLLWLLHLLRRIAESSFDAFRPALGGSAADQERARLTLTSIPDRVALVSAIVAVVVLNVTYFGTIRPLRPPLPLTVELASGVLYVLAAASIGLLVAYDIRQLRYVSRLSSLAANVDIFKPGPVTALSRLTATTAIGILAFVAAYALSTAITVPTSEQADVPTFLVEEAVMIGLALASFVLPLRVMHGRLLDEKNELVADAQDRLKTTLARLHHAVESNDLSDADKLNMTLASVLAEREVLTKLATWPWSTGTYRGVVSAVLLPVLIFLITRLIDQLI